MKEKNIYYPLGDAQKVIRTGEQFAIERKKVKESSYIQFYISTGKTADIETEFKAFEKALNSVVKNNDALRIRMKRTLKGLRQYVSDYKEFKLDRVVLKNEVEFKKFLSNISSIKIGWTDECLFRAMFIQYSENEGAFLFKVYHTIFDGYSIRLFVEQLKKAYVAYKNNEAIDDEKQPSVIDVYKSIEEYKKSKKYQKDKAFWKNKYHNQRNFSFPAGYRSEFGDCDGVSYRLDGQDYKRFLELANNLRCSTQSLAMSTIAIGVLAITGKENFCLQSISHGRQKASQLKTIGTIQNNTPIFYDIDAKKSAKEIITESYANYLEALSHARFPQNAMIPMLYKEAFKNGMNFNVGWLLFSSMEFGALYRDIDFKLNMLGRGYQPFQFYVAMLEVNNSHIDFNITYQTRKYTRKQCEQYVAVCIELLKKVIKSPNTPLDTIM